MFNHCLFLNGSGKTTGFDVQPHAVTRLVGSNPTSCSYTAGMRVKGGAPGGKTTYSLFPGYEEQVVVSTTIRRTTDSRTEPTANLTDRGFTGHMHHNLGSGAEDIGLVYMAARWYAPTLGRFLSADTLIPDPANPQSYNRYSYVGNRPLNFSDPTGHRECGASDDCSDPLSHQIIQPIPTVPTGPMVTFSVDEGCNSVVSGACSWSDAEIATIQESATVTGTRLAETLNALHPDWNLSAEEAFLLVYGGSINFKKMGVACASGCWGETFLRDGGRHEIEVYTDIFDEDGNNNLVGDAHWAVHEFGHAFVNAIAGGTTAIMRPVTWLKVYQNMFPNFPNRPDGSAKGDTWGFAGGRWEWQRSPSGDASEEFADMYLGWVYNQWEASPAGQMRAGFTDTYMPMWVDMSY